MRFYRISYEHSDHPNQHLVLEPQDVYIFDEEVKLFKNLTPYQKGEVTFIEKPKQIKPKKEKKPYQKKIIKTLITTNAN